MAKNIEERVESLIKASIEEKGYNLYDVQYVKEGAEYYLRVFIEKDEGISLEDCETVNDIINPILDKADIIKEQYYLEVSSTGIEKNIRKLEHYKNALGQEIKVKLFKKDEKGNKELQGVLEDVNENQIIITTEDGSSLINLDNVSQAKTVYHW